MEERKEGDGEYHYMPGGSLKNYVGGKFSRASTKEERGKVENTRTSCLLQLTPVTLRPPSERMGARENMFGLVERCTLAASRLGCLMVRQLWSIQVVGDMSENLWRGRCTGRERLRGRTEPLTRACSTTRR